MSDKFDPRSHIGEEYGLYRIVDVLDEKDKYGHYVYIAQCKKCGYKKRSHYGGIKHKAVNECMHFRFADRYLQRVNWDNKRIGRIFHGMKSRCYNPNDKNYRWYGEKGINICDEWLDDEKSFEDWALQNGYEPGLTIDRIDEDKDYSPDNCRWIDLCNNAKYKSTTSLIDIDGEVLTGRDWSIKLGLGVNTINTYIREYGEENTKTFIRKFMNEPKRRIGKRSYYEMYNDEYLNEVNT